MRQSSFPVRQSSLAASHKAHDDIRRNDDDEELYLEVENVQLFQSLKDPNAVTAAGQRAELYLLQSRILGILQRQGEWGFANDVTPSDEQSTEFTKEHVSDKAGTVDHQSTLDAKTDASRIAADACCNRQYSTPSGNGRLQGLCFII